MPIWKGTKQAWHTSSSPNSGSGSSVRLWMDATYQFLMLFTGDSLPIARRRRKGLGVEPMTCAPNALQSGEGLQSPRAR